MVFFGTNNNPKGPSLNSLEEHQINLSGISLNLRMPVSNIRTYVDKVNKQTKNLYDPTEFHSSIHEDPCTPPELSLITNGWRYKGFTLFDNEMGRMLMDCSVAHMPEFNSLFRPRRLECAIERFIYLSELFSWDIESRLGYELRIINGINWAHYTCRAEEEESSARQSVWQTPLTDEHLLTIFFNQTGKLEKTGLKAAYSRLVEYTMNNFTIDWPQDILRQKAAIKNEFPYESFPNSLSPYLYRHISMTTLSPKTSWT